MPDNVVIKFESDITGLAPAYEALLRIGKITEDDVKAFEKATAAQKDLAATATKGVSSFDKLAEATTNVKKNIIDGATNQAIEGTNKLIEEGTKKTNDQKEAIKAQKAEIKELTDYIKTLQKESSKAAPGQIKSDINKQILEAKFDLEELKKGLNDLNNAGSATPNKTVTATSKEIEKQTGLINELMQKQKDLTDERNRSTDEASIKKFNALIDENKTKLEALIQTEKKEENEIKVYDNSIRGLKQQYKDLISLAIQSGEESPIGQQALRDAGELRDRIGDLMATTQAYASDTATFDAIGEGISTIGAGFEAAEGAQALFGEGGEALQKTMVRLQATMALVNGLQTIQNNLQAESALRLKITAVSQYVLNGAQLAYTAVVGTSTGALKLLRLAFAATGIGALIIGIVLLIQNFEKVRDFIVNIINKFEFLKKGIEVVIEAFNYLKDALGFGPTLSENLEKFTEYLDSIYKGYEGLQKRVLALKKSQDQNTLALEKKTNELLLLEQNLLYENQKKAFIEKAKETGKIEEEDKKKLIEQTIAYNETIVGLMVRNNDIEYEVMQRALQSRKNQIDARLQFAQRGSENELKLKLNQIAAELAIENSQRDKIAGQVTLNEAKANVARKQAFEDYKAFQIQSAIEGENKRLTVVQVGSLEELKIRRNVLELENELTVNNSKLSQSQKELNIAQNAQKELELIRKYGEAQVKLAEQIETKKQTVGNDRLQKYQEDLNAEYQYYNEIADLEFQGSSQTYAKLEKLRIEKFNRNVGLLDAELAKVEQTNENIVASEEKLQRDLAAKAQSDPANRQQYELAIVQSEDRVKTAEQKTADEIVRINREKNKQIIANDNEAEANKKANLLKQVDTYQNLANQSADFLKQANDTELQQNLDKIQKETDINQQNLDNKIINESEYARKKKVLDDKVQQEKVKAAKKEKSIQSVMTVVNTASSIVKTGAELGYPVAIPFQVLAAAVGALQLAAINNIKIPEFAKGTNFAPKGWAWVGEQGPELVSLNGGEKIKTADQSKAFAEKEYNENFNTLASSIDTSPVLSKSGMEATKYFQSKPSVSLDYHLLSGMISSGVGEHISRMPITHFTLDKTGFSVAVAHGSNKTNYLDNRYSTN